MFDLGCAWKFGLSCCFLFKVGCLKLTFHSDFMLTSSRMGRDIHLYRYLTHWIISSLTWNKNYWLAHLASQCIKRNRQWKVSGIFCQKHLVISDMFHIHGNQLQIDKCFCHKSSGQLQISMESEIKNPVHLELSILVVLRCVYILKCRSWCFCHLFACTPQKSCCWACIWKVTSVSLLMNPLLRVLSQQITEVLH